MLRENWPFLVTSTCCNGLRFRTLINDEMHVMWCDVMWCDVMWCYVMLCYVMLCYVMLCYVMLCYVCYVRSWAENDLRRPPQLKLLLFVVPNDIYNN
jgi:hypothetical protein